ncbi:MAG: Stp1/IreP family PP2C-type Ser/Thr phosphatase [Lachnospiraceae bacterium]|nr:Stp1/IreP family PP2C-type Ser/Thr phosphatase [Lachnospiraceae bacterium]
MKVFALTDKGKVRSQNQDYFYVSSEPVGILDNLFVVCDGIGGNKAGDYASRFVTEKFVEEVKIRDEKIFAVFDDAVVGSNRRLMEEAASSPAYEGMGTTLVSLTVKERLAVIANVGDSRAYVYCDSQLRQITKDHSVIQELMDLNIITKDEAKNHPRRNAITKAMGYDFELLPDIFDFEVKKGDIILLCTDGLTNMVEDDDIKDIISKKAEMEVTGWELMNKALDNGGKDNITIVLVEIEEGDMAC